MPIMVILAEVENGLPEEVNIEKLVRGIKGGISGNLYDMRVTLHGALNGFRAGWGSGTENLEAKLAQQLGVIAHKLLFQLFLALQKA